MPLPGIVALRQPEDALHYQTEHPFAFTPGGGLVTATYDISLTGRRALPSCSPTPRVASVLNDKTVVRGAFGIGYLFRDTSLYNFPLESGQRARRSQCICSGRLNADRLSGSNPVANPSNGVITNAPLALTYGVMPQDLVHGSVQSWNLAVERELPAGFTFEAAYAGNHGVEDPVALQLNRGLSLGGGAAGQPLNQLLGRRASTTTTIGVSTHYNSL